MWHCNCFTESPKLMCSTPSISAVDQCNHNNLTENAGYSLYVQMANTCMLWTGLCWQTAHLKYLQAINSTFFFELSLSCSIMSSDLGQVAFLLEELNLPLLIKRGKFHIPCSRLVHVHFLQQLHRPRTNSLLVSAGVSCPISPCLHHPLKCKKAIISLWCELIYWLQVDVDLWLLFLGCSWCKEAKLTDIFSCPREKVKPSTTTTTFFDVQGKGSSQAQPQSCCFFISWFSCLCSSWLVLFVVELKIAGCE